MSAKTPVTEKEIETEFIAAHLAELVMCGSLTEEEHDALASTWRLRQGR